MKLSVSLPDEVVRFLDEYTEAEKLASRSAALVRAVRLLRGSELGPAYDEAFAGWSDEEDGTWDASVADGLG